MGCSQSKIENEEAVSRCKDRKLHMKDAVTARNAFAAAHTGYAMSLKNTGAALSDYAHGEVQPSQHGVPSVTPATFDNLPPPPPPLPNFSNTPLQRAASLPERLISKSSHPGVGPVIEEEDEDEIDDEESVGRLRRRRRSSRGSAGAGSSGMGNRDLEEEVEGPPPPVPPPPSRTTPPSENRYIPTPILQNSTYDFFFNVDNMPSSSLSEPDEIKVNENEIERKTFVEKPKKMDGGDAEERKGKAEAAAPFPEKTVEAAKNTKKVKQVGVAGPAEGKRIVKSNVNLLQIFVDLDDHFLKASESAHEVSKMLEATRLHYHSNFADNRGHIDHSARVMRVITWNRSFRMMPNMDDGKDDFDAEEHETHATVLDKLLAWEKKLYDEVKAGEVMKIEYQRKVNTLNKLRERGSNTEALEKAKAAVSHLHTRYIVDLQSMDSTVLEINRLRDQQLYPKLVQLIDGMAVMWETMQIHHSNQFKIVYALKSLDLPQSLKETSEHHHERTFQLWAVVREWHSQFEKLVAHQKNYVKSLSNWLKLNLVPIESSLKEKVSSPPRVQIPPIHGLLQAWQVHLEKLPDGLLRTAIFAFGALINTIRQYQEEEMKLKMKCEETRKELSRKTRLFDDWYNKYMQRKIPEVVDPERTDENTQRDIVAEKQFAVETVRKRLEEEEEARLRQSLQVREKSLVSLKSHLPELFTALSEFSSGSLEMYRSLSSLSQQQSSIPSPA